MTNNITAQYKIDTAHLLNKMLHANEDLAVMMGEKKMNIKQFDAYVSGFVAGISIHDRKFRKKENVQKMVEILLNLSFAKKVGAVGTQKEGFEIVTKAKTKKN